MILKYTVHFFQNNVVPAPSTDGNEYAGRNDFWICTMGMMPMGMNMML